MDNDTVREWPGGEWPAGGETGGVLNLLPALGPGFASCPGVLSHQGSSGSLLSPPPTAVKWCQCLLISKPAATKPAPWQYAQHTQ